MRKITKGGKITKEAYEERLRKLDQAREDAAKHAGVIDKDAVEEQIARFKAYIKENLEYDGVHDEEMFGGEDSQGAYNGFIKALKKYRLKMSDYLAKRPYLKTALRLAAYPAAIVGLYYLTGVERIADSYFIGGPNEINMAAELAEQYDFVEFMPYQQTIVSAIGGSIKLPLRFSLPNANFLNTSSMIAGAFIVKHFVRKRRMTAAFALPVISGLSLSLAAYAMTPHIPKWWNLISQLRSNEVPLEILSIMSKLRTVIDTEDVFGARGWAPFLFMALGGTIGALYAIYKKRKSTEEKYEF